MSVLIKGMEMPEKCADCIFIDYFKGKWYCHTINDLLETGSNERDNRCPLVEVKTPHGRLIDADALKQELRTSNIIHHYGTQILVKIDNSKTFLEPEEGADNE